MKLEVDFEKVTCVMDAMSNMLVQHAEKMKSLECICSSLSLSSTLPCVAPTESVVKSTFEDEVQLYLRELKDDIQLYLHDACRKIIKRVKADMKDVVKDDQ